MNPMLRASLASAAYKLAFVRFYILNKNLEKSRKSKQTEVHEVKIFPNGYIIRMLADEPIPLNP